jgi:hypothetical protein
MHVITKDDADRIRSRVAADIGRHSNEVYLIDCRNAAGWKLDSGVLKSLPLQCRDAISRYCHSHVNTPEFDHYPYDWGKILYSKDTGVVIIDFYDHCDRTVIRRVGHVCTLHRAAADIQTTMLDTSSLRTIFVGGDIARFILANDLNRKD